MKKHIVSFILLFMPMMNFYAQTWQSINYAQFSNVIPYGQFVINQNNNDIWMVNDNKVSVIEGSGVVQIFDYTDLGTLWTGDNLRFTFTPDSIFYMLETIGLMNFNNYVSSSIIVENNISDITSNGDTVYISRAGTLLEYVDGVITDTYFSAPNISVKNTFLYTDNGYLGKQNGFSNQMLIADPQYLLAPINDKRFQRKTDSIYVGTTKGIMYAFNYDILDTITPNNTSNMPSGNVLEIEFDDNDILWAVFGDASDIPFAIAKLEGNIWTNIFDNSNSPINFSMFEGLEIDTLGNLWVADQISLHTLLSPNSPGWLSTTDLKKDRNFTLYPNPSSQNLSITSTDIIDEIQIVDLFGRVLKIKDGINSTVFDLELSDLSNGNYFVKVISGNSIEFLPFIKE